MWTMKEGYDYIAVNLGGFQLCASLDEAAQVAKDMKPDKGQVYSNGFYSESVKEWIGRGKYFFVQ